MLKKNILYLFIVQGGNYIIPLLTFPYLLRVLGPYSFGLFGFFQATIQYCILLVEFGFNWTATEAVAKSKEDKSSLTGIFWAVFWAKLFLSIIAIVILIGLCLLFSIYSKHIIVVIAFIPLIIGNVIYPVWFFQGIEEMKWITICTLTARILIIPMTFLLVRNSDDIWIAASVQSFAMILSGVIAMFIIIKKKWISKICFNYSLVKKCLNDSWHLFISTSAISLYTTSTTVILGALVGPVAVGYYNTANTIRGAAQGLLNPIAQAVYPRVSALINDDYNNALLMIRKTFKYFCSIALICSLFIFLFSEPIIRTVAGNEYDNAISVLRWMAFIPFLVAMSNVFGVQTMLTHGYKKEFSRILILSGGVNLAIIFPLVHFLLQDGAAISLLVSEIFVTIAMYSFLRKKKIYLI